MPVSERQFPVLNAAVGVGLILAILAVYSQVRKFDFVNYDDPNYVSANPYIQSGITPGSVKSAFTRVVVSTWVPVTMLSHVFDVQFFGMRSGLHHLVNVLLHIMAALLLFATLQRATGATGASAFTAFLFALHPLHVESVAWIAERKDVMSAFFWFLSLYAYVRYAERRSLGRYLLVVGAFGLGLLSKPMLVTLPFTLLLFDFWPLRRVQFPKMLWEKVPLFALSAGSCAVTYLIQKMPGSVVAIPLETRLENALLSCVTYLGQMFWPARLAVFYPYPQAIPAWQAAFALVVVLGLSTLAVLAWRSCPYCTVGWFWYLGTLIPVIGLVQVGYQSHADRYTYIPMVGLIVILAWGGADVVRKWPGTRPAVLAAAVLSCGMCVALAWKQTSYWQNSESLFQHSIEVTADNWVAQGNLGLYLTNFPARRAEAVVHLEEALRIKPDYTIGSKNLAACLIEAGLCGAAIPHLEAVLRADPTDPEANANFGVCLLNSGRNVEAAERFEAALRVKVKNARSYFNLGLALSRIPGRSLEAASQYEAGLLLSPGEADAQRNLGLLYLDLGRTQQAVEHLAAYQRLRADPEISKIVDRLRAGER